MIFATGQRRNKPCNASAFTLVELILVMTILVIVISVAGPTMSGFFRGRKQESEARQVLSLIRYGQSRAVAEGMPMQLWINEHDNTYGLEMEPGYADDDSKAVDFEVDDVLNIKIEETSGIITKSDKLPTIRFEPDGSIDASSPVTISINQDKSNPILIVQNENGLSYEIKNNNKTIQNTFR
jgi:Tfp pilus assembly protein FimT